MVARWPHPSPWWGAWLWPKVIVGLVGLFLFQTLHEVVWRNWWEDRRDSGSGGPNPPDNREGADGGGG